MAKIPFLYGQKRASGAVAWHWKPSPRLRKAGWTNQHLGDGTGKHPPVSVVDKAMELNRQLEAWDMGYSAATAPVKAVPRKWRWDDLILAYKASDAYQSLRANTRREYDSRIRQLTFWAQDGKLYIRDIDQQMVIDLKEAMMAPAEDGTPASRFKVAAMLRVLRLLMNFAVPSIIPFDPTKGVAIPTPPSRRTKLEWREVEEIAALARDEGDEATALFIEISFWSMQRQADVLKFNKLSWRTFEALDARDRPALVDQAGNVRGFRVLPEKTKDSSGKWIDAPMPPFLHESIVKRFEDNQWLFPHPEDTSTPMRDHTIQRAARAILNKAGYPAYQLRDLRRSGMSWMKDMGALQSNIFAISGHAVLGKTSIVDTYMPPDTKAACAAIAAVLRTMQAIEEREQVK